MFTKNTTIFLLSLTLMTTFALDSYAKEKVIQLDPNVVPVKPAKVLSHEEKLLESNVILLGKNNKKYTLIPKGSIYKEGLLKDKIRKNFDGLGEAESIPGPAILSQLKNIAIAFKVHFDKEKQSYVYDSEALDKAEREAPTKGIIFVDAKKLTPVVSAQRL